MSSTTAPIKGFPNYLAHRDGYLINTLTGRILKGCKGAGGYIHSNIVDEHGKLTTVYFHRLIASAFCENYDEFERNEVNHIDGDKTNNRSDNLEWVTRKENLAHALKTGLRKTIPVIATNCETGKRLRFNSMKEGAEYFQIAISHISLCCSGKVPHANGYYWEYLEEGSNENA